MIELESVGNINIRMFSKMPVVKVVLCNFLLLHFLSLISGTVL